jgi:hypothetical protein
MAASGGANAERARMDGWSLRHPPTLPPKREPKDRVSAL